MNMKEGAGLKTWRVLLAGVIISAVIITAFLGSAFLFRSRAEALNDHIYEQCVRDEVQDTIIAAQLRAAKRRVIASLPKYSAEAIYQLQILNDGIDALEPPGEQPCEPPEGVGP